MEFETPSWFLGLYFPSIRPEHLAMLLLFILHAVLALIQPFPSTLPDEWNYLTGAVPSIYAVLGYRAGMVFMAACYALCLIPLTKITRDWRAALILCLYPAFFIWAPFAMVEGAFWLCVFSFAAYYQDRAYTWLYALSAAVIKPLGFALVCLKVFTERPPLGILVALACLVALPFVSRGLTLVPMRHWASNIMLNLFYGLASGGLVLPILAVLASVGGDLSGKDSTRRGVLLASGALIATVLATGFFIPTEFVDGRYAAPVGILLAALGFRDAPAGWKWRLIGVPVLFTPLIMLAAYLTPLHQAAACLVQDDERCELFRKLISGFA